AQANVSTCIRDFPSDGDQCAECQNLTRGKQISPLLEPIEEHPKSRIPLNSVLGKIFIRDAESQPREHVWTLIRRFSRACDFVPGRKPIVFASRPICDDSK